MNKVLVVDDLVTNINKVKIDNMMCKAKSSLGTKVYLNGMELHGVLSVGTMNAMDRPRTVTIEMIADAEFVNSKDGGVNVCNS